MINEMTTHNHIDSETKRRRAIVVTRHKIVYDYLVEYGHVDEETDRITNARPEDVAGKHIFGTVPIALACHAASVTVLGVKGLGRIPMTLEQFARGVRMRTYMVLPVRHTDVDEDTDQEKTYEREYEQHGA